MRPGLELVDSPRPSSSPTSTSSSSSRLRRCTPRRCGSRSNTGGTCSARSRSRHRAARRKQLFALARERGLRLVSAPFVQTNPTFRELWTIVQDGAIGRVHSPARSTAPPARLGDVVPRCRQSALPDIGIHNLRSLTALCGPVVETYAADVTAVPTRVAAGVTIDDPDPDTVPPAAPPRGGRALVDRLEPRDPALPPPGARTVRRRGHGQPARRRLGPGRLRALAEHGQHLGAARADRLDLALDGRPARARAGDPAGACPSLLGELGSASRRDPRERPRVDRRASPDPGRVQLQPARAAARADTRTASPA